MAFSMSLEELKVNKQKPCSMLMVTLPSDLAHLIKCLSSKASDIDLIGKQNKLSYEETTVCPVQERFPFSL